MRITDQDINQAADDWAEDLKYYSDHLLDRPKAQQALDNLLFLEKQLQEKGFSFHQIQEVHARACYRVYKIGGSVNLAYDRESGRTVK